MNVVSLGVNLLVFGAILLLAFLFLMWVVPRLRVRGRPDEGNATFPENQSEQKEMTLVIKPGGKLVYLNQEARRVFGLGGEELPGLERLAQRVRPSESFLSLAGGEGSARLVLFGRQMEAASHWIVAQNNAEMVMVIRPESTGQVEDGAENPSAAVTRGLKIVNDLTGSQFDSNELDSVIKAL